MSVQILSGGLSTTIQDLGRTGYQQFGVPAAGAADSRSFRIANLLVGNEENAAGLECTLTGPTIEFTSPCVFAVTGADMRPTLNGNPVQAYRAIHASAKDILSLGAAVSGCRAYIALGGGVDIRPVMGSRSTYEKAVLGGWQGRALREGDALPLLPADPPVGLFHRFIAPERFDAGVVTLRAVEGPQSDRFTGEGLSAFWNGAYAVTNRSDRMGCRLEGDFIAHTTDANIRSDGIALGAVQVPDSGQPIVMLADRQTTGGYTKIATVISADIPLIAQRRPGDEVRFRKVSVEEAQSAYLAELAFLRSLRERFSREPLSERRFRITVGGGSYEVSVAEITGS